MTVDRQSSAMWRLKGVGAPQKSRDNPMDPVLRLRQAPRCSATSKRTGRPCRAPAERGKRVCRFHGARAGAPKGPANGRYCHGAFTKAALEERRALAELLRQARDALRCIG